MPLLGAKTKQPREELPVDIDYTDVIAGRPYTSITPTVEVPVGMTKVSAEVSGTVLQIYLAGGTDGQHYHWTVLTEIVIGGKTTKVEDEFDVVVEET
jgi:hypothetical protein